MRHRLFRLGLMNNKTDFSKYFILKLPYIVEVQKFRLLKVGHSTDIIKDNPVKDNNFVLLAVTTFFCYVLFHQIHVNEWDLVTKFN